MQPTSPWVVVLLVIVCGGTLATLVGARQWPVRAACGLLAVGLGMLLGMVAVNDHYGYYSSWSSLASDVSGSVPETTLPGAADVAAHDTLAGGALLHVALPGQLSRIHRDGLVYLPPQYFQPRYRRVFFPVVELFHGAPGGPGDWVLALHLPQVEQALISRHRMGPVVLVMPRIAPLAHVEECLDAGRVADETYLVADVRHDVEARFRVSRSSWQWAVGGYSSGGYCAANLALRDRTAFHAAFAMDGYFQATDGPAATILHKRRAAELANSPLYEASRLRRPVSTMPTFWVSAGTGNKDDLAPGR